MLYPQQNKARLKLSLNGIWDFALGSTDEAQFDPAQPLPDPQPIAVPASYNDQNDQTTALRRHYGWAWYQRSITLPASAPASGWSCGSGPSPTRPRSG